MFGYGSRRDLLVLCDEFSDYMSGMVQKVIISCDDSGYSFVSHSPPDVAEDFLFILLINGKVTILSEILWKSIVHKGLLRLRPPMINLFLFLFGGSA